MRRPLPALLILALLATASHALDISGNYFRKSYELTADTTFTNGNGILCEITNVGQLTIFGEDLGDHGGQYSLTVLKGNVPGIHINGVKLDEGYVWRRSETFPLAVEILERAGEKQGELGVQLWAWAVAQVVADPEISAVDLYAAWDLYADQDDPNLPGAPLSAIDVRRAFPRLKQFAFPGLTYGETKLAILNHSDPVATWAGAKTELAEEYE